MKILRFVLFAFCCVSLAHAEDALAAKPPIKPDMVKADVFTQRYHRVGMAETMHYTEFVGVVDGVAILRIQDMNPLTQGWRKKWIGVKVVDLDPVLRVEIEKQGAEIQAKQEAEAKLEK